MNEQTFPAWLRAEPWFRRALARWRSNSRQAGRPRVIHRAGAVLVADDWREYERRDVKSRCTASAADARRLAQTAQRVDGTAGRVVDVYTEVEPGAADRRYRLVALVVDDVLRGPRLSAHRAQEIRDMVALAIGLVLELGDALVTSWSSDERLQRWLDRHVRTCRDCTSG